MINLIKSEFIKIISKKSTKISVLIISALIVFSCILDASSEVTPDNWRNEVRKEVEDGKAQIEEDKGTEFEEFTNLFYEDVVAIGEYSLEHDIAYNVITPVKFCFNNLFVASVLMILVIIIAVINYSDEYQFGTIRQILTRPYPKVMILVAKEMVFFMITIMTFFVQFLVSYIVGLIFFGKNGSGVIELCYIDGKVIETNMLMTLIQTYLCYIVITMFLIAFAYLLVSITRTSMMPIIITLTAWIGRDLIWGYLEKYKIEKFTFFPHIDLTQYIKGNQLVLEGNTIGFSIFIVSISYILIQIATAYIFNTRDN